MPYYSKTCDQHAKPTCTHTLLFFYFFSLSTFAIQRMWWSHVCMWVPNFLFQWLELVQGQKGTSDWEGSFLCTSLSEPQMNKEVGDFFMKLRQTRLFLGFLRYPYFEFLCILPSCYGMAWHSWPHFLFLYYIIFHHFTILFSSATLL